MRICYFSPDYAIRNGRPLFGGSPYYRCILPAKELVKHGYETYVSPTIIVHQETGYLTGQTAMNEIPDPDIMVIHSWPENGVEAIRRAREAGQIVIGDVDDLMWELPQGHQAEGLATTEDKSIENIWNNLMTCSALTVSTPYLKKWIQMKTFTKPSEWICPLIYVVRNAIDLEAFTYNSMRDKVRVIGWSGNPLWRADDLSLLRPWLRQFLDKHNLVFMHVGALPHASIREQLDIPKARLVERPFKTFEDYRPSNPLKEMDIQLIPLLDCPFNRAKSALKGLESAAWGIPFITNARTDAYAETFATQLGKEWSLEKQCEFMLVKSWRLEQAQWQYEFSMSHDITSRWQDWAHVYQELAAS